MKIDLNKWITVVRAGEHAVYDSNGSVLYSANITNQDLQEMATYYDPAYHQAFWCKGHPWDRAATEALGWIAELRVVGDELQVRNESVTDEMEKLILEKRFKKMSITMTKEKIGDKVVSYLHDIGMTNAEMCKNLEELQKLQMGVALSQTKQLSYFAQLSTFPLNGNESDQDNQNLNNQNHSMEKLKNTASQLGLDTVGLTEDQISQKIVDKFKELSAARENAFAVRNEFVLETAMKENKILPADKEKYAKLLAADFESTSALIAGMKAGTQLGQNQMPGGDGSEQLPGDPPNTQLAGVPADRKDWDLRKWEKEDPAGLKELATKFPDAFKSLEAKAYESK